MYSVQAEGCQPIVRAWAARNQGPRPADGNARNLLLPASPSEPEAAQVPSTVAAGLRVPKALGDFIILDILERSGGAAIAVSDADLMSAARLMASRTGVSACPEGGACLAALQKLAGSGDIKGGESVVLFNTGSGLKYAEAYSAFPA